MRTVAAATREVPIIGAIAVDTPRVLDGQAQLASPVTARFKA
jgi:hypothetical protein